MRLINANTLILALRDKFMLGVDKDIVLNLVDSSPTVDAEEVVYCKDCKYYKESRMLAPNKFCFRLNHPTEPGKIGYNFSENDFCSRGVRKDGDNAEG